jgi:hypothetical protein
MEFFRQTRLLNQGAQDLIPRIKAGAADDKVSPWDLLSDDPRCLHKRWQIF